MRSYLFLIIAGIFLGSALIAENQPSTGLPPAESDAFTPFSVSPGSSLRSIARNLEDTGLVPSALVFELVVRLSGEGSKFQAGDFLIPNNAGTDDLVKILTGPSNLHQKITIPEGFSQLQIVSLLSEYPDMTGEIESLPGEGLLLPETYFVSRNDKRQELIDRMEQAMRNLLNELWEQRPVGLPYSTPEDALVLASIVEKETPKPAEYALVASVFLNRLNLGMPLQADPTVIYGLTFGAALERPLTRRDLEKESPYNTYLHKGLPPTPIANPGAGALKAVFQPAQSDYLYFVADGTGGHVFARTYAEHLKNVENWRKIRALIREGNAPEN